MANDVGVGALESRNFYPLLSLVVARARGPALCSLTSACIPQQNAHCDQSNDDGGDNQVLFEAERPVRQMIVPELK